MNERDYIIVFGESLAGSAGGARVVAYTRLRDSLNDACFNNNNNNNNSIIICGTENDFRMTVKRISFGRLSLNSVACTMCGCTYYHYNNQSVQDASGD